MTTPDSCGERIRLLTAVPLCDGHDSAVMAVNQALIRGGFEVVYLGYHRAVSEIVRAAIQEDVAAIGISSYNGGHLEFFREVLEALKEAGRSDIGVFGGGGGTITPADVTLMKDYGVDEIFLAGVSFEQICERLRELYAKKATAEVAGNAPAFSDSELGRLLTDKNAADFLLQRGDAKVIGFTGPGGAGKTTLIDEWIRGFLESNKEGRIAVLTHDPSSAERGGLLADRASMVYAQNDRVFIRSLATRGRQGGLAPSSENCLQWLTSEAAGFDHVLVETVGTGQEALPFSKDLVDLQVLVLHPEYGARLQLQKILMLEVADAVVVNKRDWAGAARAIEEIQSQLSLRAGKPVVLFETQASEHGNAGVEKLRKELLR